MSKKLTLHQAIKHCEETANREDLCEECRNEHKQLAKWLKAFEIIKEKEIDIKHIKDCKTIYEYSIYYRVGEMPTKEEFELLKEVLK